MNPGGIDIIRIVSGASYMVQFVLLLLLFFSVTSWAIILIKWYYMRRAFRESGDFMEIFWESRDLSVAYKEARLLDGSPIARVFTIGYMNLKKLGGQVGGKSAGEAGGSLSEKFSGIDNVKRSLRRSINTEVTRMTQMVPFLATAGNTTPFIGLFGTVWGIMESFHSIGLSGSASLAVVAPGISEALVATAAGLGVAIPSVIAFNYFMQRIRVMESELQSFMADFLNIIEMDILPAKGSR
ncbi:protein TolQ [Desulfonema ishimotonii]|uniref:Protein TolQ n=1 Tax=Desulfonema ishimotonii TaxID=45657 RepID=A0A401FX20_9BACT|nr:MotA/TolQ/ExbB proton channel family protein [Desulfonema ishimotonii]GBC61528.1 protein TolQ [Desulfonema ishimotonii]